MIQFIVRCYCCAAAAADSDLIKIVTIKVGFELMEGIGAIVRTEADSGCVAFECVNESLSKDLLVCLSASYLHLLQFQQLLEDFPLQIVPRK